MASMKCSGCVKRWAIAYTSPPLCSLCKSNSIASSPHTHTVASPGQAAVSSAAQQGPLVSVAALCTSEQCLFCQQPLSPSVTVCTICGVDQHTYAPDVWICHGCTFENGSDNSHCAGCSTERSTSPPAAPPLLATPPAAAPPLLVAPPAAAPPLLVPPPAAAPPPPVTPPAVVEAQVPSAEDTVLTCMLCADDTVSSSDMFSGCELPICKECVKRSAQVMLEQFRNKGSDGVLTITCPMRCHELSYTNVRLYSGFTQEQLDFYNNSRRASMLSQSTSPSRVHRNCSHCQGHCDVYLENNPRYFTCHNLSCEQMLTCVEHGQPLNSHVLEKMDGQRLCAIPHVIDTGGSRVKFCQACYDSSLAEFTPEMAAELGYKMCPKCDIPIEKNEGCKHMTCTYCKHEFFWCCLRAYRVEEESREHYRSQLPECDICAVNSVNSVDMYGGGGRKKGGQRRA